MGFFDRHKRHGVVPALIALSFQIVFGFDHVHLHGVTQNAAQNSRAAITQSVALTQPKSKAPAQIPADNDDYCAICASIFLASSAFAPAPPQLLIPANFQQVEHSSNAASLVAQPPRLAFRSRAPPRA
jgi:hypothetical protein